MNTHVGWPLGNHWADDHVWRTPSASPEYYMTHGGAAFFTLCPGARFYQSERERERERERDYIPTSERSFRYELFSYFSFSFFLFFFLQWCKSVYFHARCGQAPPEHVFVYVMQCCNICPSYCTAVLLQSYRKSSMLIFTLLLWHLAFMHFWIDSNMTSIYQTKGNISGICS